MDTDLTAALPEEPGVFTNPWPALKIGLAASVAALMLCLVLGPGWLGAWLAFWLLGLAATGAGVVIRPRSPAVLGTATGVGLIGWLIAVEANWDFSMPLFFGIVTVLAGLSAVLMLVPQAVRRFAVSLLILFHFGGIFTAITAAPPQSWLSNRLWTCVYRPYLQFVYLLNAYHFYSPEPGPATLLWYRIEYEPDSNGTKYTRWIKVPNLDEKGHAIDDKPEGGLRRIPGLLFTRRLSLAENASQPWPLPANFVRLTERRAVEGVKTGVPMPNVTPALQYKEPGMASKFWLSCYVRHVARTYKHADRPDKKVHRVKVYRVTHNLISAPNYADGQRLDDQTLYQPYFMGEYDADGNLLSRTLTVDATGNIFDDHDPFLYWLIPIVPDIPADQKEHDFNYKVIDLLHKHAGDSEEDQKQ